MPKMTSYFEPTRRLNRIPSHRGEWGWFDDGIITIVVSIIVRLLSKEPRVAVAILITFAQLDRQCRDAVNNWLDTNVSNLRRLASSLLTSSAIDIKPYTMYKRALEAVLPASVVKKLLEDHIVYGRFTLDGKREFIAWATGRCMYCGYGKCEKRFGYGNSFDRLMPSCHGLSCCPFVYITTQQDYIESTDELTCRQSTKYLMKSFDRYDETWLRKDMLTFIASESIDRELVKERGVLGRHLLFRPMPGIPVEITYIGLTKHTTAKLNELVDAQLQYVIDRRAAIRQRKIDQQFAIRENRVRNLEVNARFELSKSRMTLDAFQAAEKTLGLDPVIPHRPLPGLDKLGPNDINELESTQFRANLERVLASLE